MNNTDTTHTEHPVLIMIRGLPGSGKSYLASALQSALGADNVVLLDPDAVDYTDQAYNDLSHDLAEQGVEEKFHPNRYLKSLGYKALDAGKTIIWNQAFTDLGGFGRSHGSLQDYAAEHGISLPLLVVEVQVDPTIAKARVAERVASGGHEVSTEAFARFIDSYKSFAGEGYDTVTVHGHDDVSASVATVLRALQTLQEQQ
jgi:predicted ABC-type ATPase